MDDRAPADRPDSEEPDQAGRPTAPGEHEIADGVPGTDPALEQAGPREGWELA